jgi:catechol 2,3-dioxygenase-like lactoylglutathione lyase family enzyme
MEQRVSLITLGVAGLARARRFYEDGLGWRRGTRDDGVAFYQAGGAVLALFSRAELAADAGLSVEGLTSASPSAARGTFDGIALAYNTRTRGDVDRLLAEAVGAGATLLKPARDTVWGGYSGYFADPDGHLWEVAWNPHWRIRDDGAVELGGPAGDG